MAQRRPAPLASEWEAHKARIEELYYSGSLDDLVREMEHAGFFATYLSSLTSLCALRH
jgi:hypothetical protein